VGPGRYFGRCDRRRHTNADANCHCHGHRNCNAIADSYTAPDTYAEASPDTEASSYASAAAIDFADSKVRVE
jgi:hypothetical protein